MKRTILTILVAIFAASTLIAQNANKEENPNAPVITFEKIVHNYGTINQNADGTCQFEFTNSGKEPLILSRPKSSCGCTVPTWPKQPILPGKTDAVKVTYSTKRIGPINKTVTIYSNASNSPVVLRIKGKVIKNPDEVMPEKQTDASATPVNK